MVGRSAGFYGRKQTGLVVSSIKSSLLSSEPSPRTVLTVHHVWMSTVVGPKCSPLSRKPAECFPKSSSKCFEPLRSFKSKRVFGLWIWGNRGLRHFQTLVCLFRKSKFVRLVHHGFLSSAALWEIQSVRNGFNLFRLPALGWSCYFRRYFGVICVAC